MNYKFKEYKDTGEFYLSESVELKSYHWEADTPYRPRVTFKFGVVNDSLVAVLKAYESNPRAIYSNVNDPVYRDSCLEFFCAPVRESKDYINVECNSKGVYLSEIGPDKFHRAFVNTKTSLEPVVKSFKSEDKNGSYWGVEIVLTKDFLSELYNINKEAIDFNFVRANFYKCGDDCEIPHYIAFSPVNTLPPGFHNPDCFAEFNKE